MFHSRFSTLAITALVPFVMSQAPNWGQCGGIGWSGPTVCSGGWICVYLNQYHSQCLQTAPTNYWFSFGDSYTSTGFDINGTQPALGNPLGNPAYPGKTAVGGPTWIDTATTVSNYSNILTYNFATNNAVVDKTLTNSTGPSLADMVQSFSNWNSGPARQPWMGTNAIFSLWFGVDDFELGPYLKNFSINDKIVNSYVQQIRKLYDLGARYFLVINVPPMERSPRYLKHSNSKRTSEQNRINDFNAKLLNTTWYLPYDEAQPMPGITIWNWDSHAYFSTVLDSPTAYGFKNSKSYGNGSQYFWGDDYHPSSTVQTLIGEQIGSFMGQITSI